RYIGKNGSTKEKQFIYDEAGQLIKIKDELGNTREFEYDANGNLIKETDPNGNTITKKYDLINRLIETADALARRTIFEYDKMGRLRAQIDPKGNKTSYQYDALGRLVRTIYPDNTKEEYIYDSVGNIISFLNKNGQKTDYQYDNLYRLVKIVDALNNETKIRYDLNGNETELINPLGGSYSYNYDELNRLIEKIDPFGNSYKYQYDAVGNITQTINKENRINSYTYDEMNRLIKVVEDAGGIGRETYFSYDEFGNRSKIIDANGFETRFEYDELNRITKHILPNGAYYSYLYDNLYNIIEKQNPDMTKIQYEYDSAYQLVKKVLPDDTYIYSYDENGNLISASNNAGMVTRSYDIMNRLKEEIQEISGHAAKTITYDYNSAGNLGHITLPDSTSITYAYDALNRVTSINHLTMGKTSYSYNSISLITEKTHANKVIQSNIYDSLGRILSIANLNSNGKDILSYEYAYTPQGNRRFEKTIFEMQGGVEKVYADIYKYDNLERVIGIKYGVPASRRAGLISDGNLPKAPEYDSAAMFEKEAGIELDALGNRIRYIENIGGILNELHYNYVGSSYQPDPLNQIYNINDYPIKWDDNGNLKEDEKYIYNWDAENRLRAVIDKVTLAAVAEYSYDAFGRRAVKRAQGKTTYYYYNGWQVVEEIDGSDNIIARYNYGIGIDEILSIERHGNIYYAHANALGSITAITDANGRVVERIRYDVFGKAVLQDADGNDIIVNGNTRSFSDISPYLYQGRRYDEETGLYYFRNRYYSPEHGRFISYDPMGYIDGMNLYEFVNGNPVNLVDPWGLDAKSIISSAISYARKGGLFVYGWGREALRDITSMQGGPLLTEGVDWVY
ncbi:MAG: hypothetical protein DRZ76_04420, partial [Candidatus Nealsonbacteria bacterium]